ncbi:MAG TPA: acetyl ornithine aminotransferase family protein, partial [Candidatus Eremiobacteraceae bacterium]|nr:acetyl ornithine aminotransferase family protein [Candidatus Eremiobacteraceae bacterium]
MMNAVKKDYPKIVVTPPGPKAEQIIAKDAHYASTSYIKEYPLVAARGEGAMLEDVDGNRYLDFMAGIAVSATGYAHPRVVAAAKSQLEKFAHLCATDFYYSAFSELCERLAKIAPGSDPKRVFLTNSGTEAVEGAIKLARSHTKRQNVIAFSGAFHGRSIAAMSLGSSKVRQRRHFGPLLPGVHHLPYDNPYRPVDWRAAARELFRERLGEDEVAAVVVEPILGEGGYVVPSTAFLQHWRDFCDRTGALLVYDEVQSGVGRTGKMFAAEALGVLPDVYLLAKGLGSGLPIGAIIARDSVMSWDHGSHGSTFGGNPVACAAALATLDLVEESLMANASAMGALLLEGLRTIARKHQIIGDVRGMGLMIGIEFVRDRATKEPYEHLVHQIELEAFKRGLLLLGCGRSTIRIAPPLVIDRD